MSWPILIKVMYFEVSKRGDFYGEKKGYLCIIAPWLGTLEWTCEGRNTTNGKSPHVAVWITCLILVIQNLQKKTKTHKVQK